jgi:hypothetical protein
MAELQSKVDARRVDFERSPLGSLQEFSHTFESAFVREWIIAAGSKEFIRPPHGFKVRLESEGDSRASGLMTFWGPVLAMGELPRKYEVTFASSDGIWAGVRGVAEFDNSRSMFRSEEELLTAVNRSSRKAQAAFLTPPSF